MLVERIRVVLLTPNIPKMKRDKNLQPVETHDFLEWTAMAKDGEKAYVVTSIGATSPLCH
jgi:hypothetical protein